MANHLERIFKSDRLVYRAMEKNEADRAFIFEHTTNVPEVFGLTTDVLFRPQTREPSDKWTDDMIDGCKLAVLICLPAVESTEGEQDQKPKPQEPNNQVSNNPEKKRNEPTPIGYIILSSNERPEDSAAGYKTGCLGVAIAKPWQGKGYGQESGRWALDWAFRWCAMHIVTFDCYSFNTVALNMYRKVGFHEEGRLRHRIWWNGAYHDTISFSILEDEWRALSTKS
ncbi:acyl-CoA N-acyltransferase [Microthyrium microscopicum]|uniref:Acyl-CoA N-acyltransferase n=1 Tax=Microthyrium microscopicum TaxID=703497 RepID=A0A6A6UAD2_9PEZI|nr:acyl-CoA N-acyltransferase [Microthyrium microscopicum]